MTAAYLSSMNPPSLPNPELPPQMATLMQEALSALRSVRVELQQKDSLFQNAAVQLQAATEANTSLANRCNELALEVGLLKQKLPELEEERSVG